jgi:NAD(P)-dependent dehydrogenase (short-subunit alcohol dehydrogenase family)
MKKHSFNISNKTILVTGASSGIGREIVYQLNSQNANIIITGRNQEKLNDTIFNIDGHNVIYSKALDLNNDEELEQFVLEMPKVDGVIFCAGIAEYTPIKLLNKNKIQKTLDTNFISQTQLTRLLIKSKKINPGGSLVYVSSLSSQQGVSATASYAASKAALNAFMRVTASELSPQKIRANSLCPGIIKTPMGTMVTELNPEIEKEYPLGLGNPSDVAYACIFFLSDESRWITGSELVIDGGLTLK